MGKTRLEVAIHDEARALVEHLKSFDGKPTLHPVGLRTAVLNVVWQLVAGKRYNIESPEVLSVLNLFETFKDNASSLIFLEVFFPALKVLPKFVRNRVFKLHVMETFRKEMTELIDVSY